MHRKSTGHAREKNGTKICRNLLQLLYLKCPLAGALTNLLTGGVWLILQHQVMFVQLEAADCDLAGKERIPHLAGSF